MKTTARLLVPVVLLMTHSIYAATPAAGSRAMLVCRMGGSMVSSVISQLDAVSTEINGKTVRVPVITALFAQLVFQHGNQANNNGAALLPGTCGWTDRAMTAAEPTRVVQNIDRLTFQETVQWGNGSTLSGATTMSGGDLDAPNKAVFSMMVIRDAPNTFQYQVLPNTKPTVISK